MHRRLWAICVHVWRRRKRAKMAAGVSFFVIVLCINYIYRSYNQVEFNFIHRQKRPQLAPTWLKNISLHKMTKSLESFLHITKDSQIEVLLMEPELAADATISQNVVEQLIQKQFSDSYDVLTLYLNGDIPLPSTYTSNKFLPSHLFVYNNNNKEELSLHLVVLYKKSDNYVLSDRVDIQSDDCPHWLNVKSLTYGHYAYSFTSINKIKTVFGENRSIIYVPENMQKFKRQLVQSRHMHCNYTRADMFYNHNKLSDAPTEWSFKAADILRKTEELLSPLDVRAVMSSGTTLGWYRQCGVIGFTTDVDVEILHSEYSNKIKPTLLKAGYTLRRQLGEVNDSLEYKLKWNGINMDLFLAYEDNGQYWVGGKFGPWKVRFSVPKYEKCWTDFYNVRFSIPCDTKTYTETTYGQNWFIPDRLWFWAFSPKSSKFISRDTKFIHTF